MQNNQQKNTVMKKRKLTVEIIRAAIEKLKKDINKGVDFSNENEILQNVVFRLKHGRFNYDFLSVREKIEIIYYADKNFFTQQKIIF